MPLKKSKNVEAGSGTGTDCQRYESKVGDTTVYIINGVDLTTCHVRCKLGYYHLELGEENPFTCVPRRDDRTRKDGIVVEPFKCEGVLFLQEHHRFQVTLFIARNLCNMDL